MPVTYFVRMHAIDGHEDEVEAILLENVECIRAGEAGNLAFAVHRSGDDPCEYWLYETRVDDAAVARHESGDAFKSYKERIRPLTRDVLLGNCEPIQAVGYPLNGGNDAVATLPHRFYGQAPIGERGTMSETHAVRLREGRIVEQFVGDSNFSIPHQELVTWGLEFPRSTPTQARCWPRVVAQQR